MSVVEGVLLTWAEASDGALVHFTKADHEADYKCPGCGSPVTFRRGHVERRGEWRPHFTHTAAEGCSGESVIHKTAKRLAADAIVRHSTRPKLLRRCLFCGEQEAPRYLPSKFDSAFLEVKHPSGRVVDVLARSSADGAELGIEIRNTHAVDEAKARDLSGANWIELVAAAVIANPDRWEIVASSSTYLCVDCVDRKRREHCARDEALREASIRQWMTHLCLAPGEEWRLLERLKLLEPSPLVLVDGAWVRRAP